MTDMVFGAVDTRHDEAILSRWWRTVDRWTIGFVLLLFVIGVLLGLAASPPLAERNGLGAFYYVKRQVAFGVLGLAAMIVISTFSPDRLRRMMVLGFIAAFIAVALLPILGTDHGKGAIRWLSIAGISVQPSEFIKPAFVIFAAWIMAGASDLNGPPGRMLSFLTAAILTLMLALQPDFGQAGLILASWGLMYFISGAPVKLLVVLGGMAGGAGWLAYDFSEHFARRIDGFLASEVDPTTQLGFATNAIQEGGLLGVGAGAGTVKWSLPDAHTDFIIAVAAEEYGVLICLVIVSLFAAIAVRSLLRLLRERDAFVRLAGVGLSALLAMQALINLGVAVRLLPAKGMTLPFISYGGSSALATGVMLGCLLALTRRRPQDDMADVLGRGR